jgi:hypothetical protein
MLIKILIKKVVYDWVWSRGQDTDGELQEQLMQIVNTWHGWGLKNLTCSSKDDNDFEKNRAKAAGG